MPAKILIIFVLFLIIASLGTALIYLLKDRNRSPRTVKALTFRIGMSIGLFLFLLLGYRVGLLRPHGLQAGIVSAQASAGGIAPSPAGSDHVGR